jgi:hypothetical protein
MEGLSMKLVTAVIKPYQLDAVKEALHAGGVRQGIIGRWLGGVRVTAALWRLGMTFPGAGQVPSYGPRCVVTDLGETRLRRTYEDEALCLTL